MSLTLYGRATYTVREGGTALVGVDFIDPERPGAL